MSTISRYGADALRRLVGEDIVALHHTVAHLPAEIATLAVVPLATTILLVTVAGPLALVALIPGLLAAAYYLFIVPRSSAKHLSLIHISEPTRPRFGSRMPSSA